MSGVEVWLYGSRARGDSDALSDTDLLVVGDSDRQVDTLVLGLDYPRINVSFYTWDEIWSMRAYGSLYLHHIALEGRRLIPSTSAPDRFPSLLTDIPQFARAREDMNGFQRAFRECRLSLEEGGWPDFECEVVATVVRHAAILGSYCLGQPAFGRELPLRVTGSALGFSDRELSCVIGAASAWRLRQAGPHTTPSVISEWLDLVGRFLKRLEEVIDDYTGLLREVA